MIAIDTVFRKSSLENLVLKKVVPGTSNHWSYYTDLLIFFLKLRLSPVCEYLNCYYKIANDYWAIPEKNETGEFEDILFKKKTLKFLGCHFTLEHPGHNSFTLANSVRLCYAPWIFQGQK